MKGKTKTQKGITLVALIITIIVLLILAVVAITAIQNDGIFSHAENAATKFNNAQTNEQRDINSYETFLNTYGGGSTGVTPDEPELPTVWTQTGTTVQKGTTILTVGDYVTYISGMAEGGTILSQEGETMDPYTDTNGWRILGAENGQILLLSNNIDTPIKYLNINGDFSETFAEICNMFVSEEYGAESARLVSVDDILRVTGDSSPELNTSYSYSPSAQFESNNPSAYTMLFENVDYITGTEFYVSGYEDENEQMVSGLAYMLRVTNEIISPYKTRSEWGDCFWNSSTDQIRVVIILDADVTMTRTSETAPWTIGTVAAE